MSKNLPEYKEVDDVYWKVRRCYCTVSNWTYGPVEDWNEKFIRQAVKNLDEAITEMLNHEANK